MATNEVQNLLFEAESSDSDWIIRQFITRRVTRLGEFRHFGSFLKVYAKFGKIVKLLWKFFMLLGKRALL